MGQACCARAQRADTDPFGKPGSSVLVMPVPCVVCGLLARVTLLCTWVLHYPLLVMQAGSEEKSQDLGTLMASSTIDSDHSHLQHQATAS